MKKMTDETFFWSIKLVCIGALAILALGIAFSARAATPAAVWDGDFSKTISGYTLDLNGNTAEGGVVTIGNTGGIKISFSQVDTITVIYKYSDLSFGKEQAIATVKSTHGEKHVTNGNAVGVELTSGNKTHGIWEGTLYGNDGSTVSATSGKFAMTYKPDEPGGTYLYTIANGSRTQVYGVEGLRSWHYKPEGVNVGGKDTGLPATGMKISAIAIFNGILSEDEMANYLFPSEQTKENAYLWLDASQGITKSGDNVTSWTTRSISGKAATSYSAGGVSKGPTVSSASAIGGQSVVDFGDAGSGMDLQFDRSTNIRTVFMVAQVDQNNDVFLLGDSTSFNFHRGQESTVGYYFANNGSCDPLVNGTYRNRIKVNSPRTTVIPSDYGLISLVASSGVAASRICQDREIGGRNGGKRIAEMIVFTCELTDEARAEIETYLMNKYFPKHTATVTEDATVSSLDWEPAMPEGGFASNAELTLNNAADRATVSLDGDLAVAKLTVSSAAEKTLAVNTNAYTATIGSYALSNAGTLMLWKIADTLDVSTAPLSGSTAATFGFDLGADNVMSARGTTADANRRYGLMVTSGTLDFTTGGNEGTTTFQGRTVTADGSNAVVRLSAADATGYANPGTRLVARNGGTIAVAQRDTCKTPVTLALGHVRFLKGCAGETTRAFDLYGNPSDWQVNGLSGATAHNPSVSTIAGADDATESDSRINIRSGAWNVTVVQTAQLDVGASIMSEGYGSTPGKLVKKGDGKLVLKSASSYSGGTEVQTGTVKVETTDALGTGGVSVADGAKIEFYAPFNANYAVANAISGAGRIEKLGAGSFKLSGNNSHSGGTTVSEGVLVVNSSTALGSGTVTVKEGAQLDLNGWGVTATFAGSGTICNSSPTAASVNGIRVLQGDEIQLTDGKLYFDLAADETLTLTAIPAANRVVISGEGRVEYASTSVPTLPAGLWAEDWTGTFAWSGFNGAAENWNPTSYYNGTNSVFEFSGTITGGWFWLPAVAKNRFGELVLKGNITFNNGHTHPTVEKEAISQYIFTKLSGTKAWTIDTSSTASPAIVIGDLADFTGNLSVKGSNSEGNGYRIVMGEGEFSVDIDSLTKKAIHFAGTATLASANLLAQSGYFVHPYATLTVAGLPVLYTGALTFKENSALCNADRNCKLTSHGGVTIASGLTIPVTVTDATGLTAGDTLIIWASQPAGDFALNVGPGIAKGTPGLVASKNANNLTVAADNTKTFFEVGDTAAAERPTTLFENDWLKDAGVWPDEATVDEIQDNLDTPNAAGITPGQAYLAGFEADEVADAAVTIDMTFLIESGKVRIHATGLPPIYARRNNAVITYTLLQTTDVTDWTSATRTDMGVDTTVDVDLTEDAEQFYRVSAEIELSPASSEIIAVVPSANIVSSGTPLLTEPGTQFAAALGSATIDEPTDTLTFQLAGAGVVEGQEYHLEVQEPDERVARWSTPTTVAPRTVGGDYQAPRTVGGDYQAPRTVGGDYQAPRTYGLIAHVLSDKTITFDFAHAVAAGTTVKLTLISDSGAANGNVCAVSTVQPTTSTFTADTIVANRVANLPKADGLCGNPKSNCYRIPALATDGNGEVVACYDVRYYNGGGSDLGNDSGIDIGESYSADGGITFDRPRLGVDVVNYYTADGGWSSGNRKYMDIGDVSVVWDPSREQYWMIGITGRGLTGLSDTSLNDVVVYTRKPGRGTAWTPWHNPTMPDEINPILYRSIQSLIMTQRGGYGRGFLQGPGHGMIVKIGSPDGTTMPVGTVVFPVQYFFEGNGQSSAGAIYLKPGEETTDNNWVSTSRTNNDGSQENCIMELDDGSWYMMCKNSTSYKAFRSTDYVNWVDVNDGLFGVTHVQGSCLKIGTKGGVGQYVFCHANASWRTNLTLFFGSDTTRSSAQELNKGINWNGLADKIVIDATDSGGMTYNSMCMLDDHTLGILWETNGHIQFTRIDVSDKVD